MMFEKDLERLWNLIKRNQYKLTISLWASLTTSHFINDLHVLGFVGLGMILFLLYIGDGRS